LVDNVDLVGEDLNGLPGEQGLGVLNFLRRFLRGGAQGEKLFLAWGGGEVEELFWAKEG
jgi:hypothetical protein